VLKFSHYQIGVYKLTTIEAAKVLGVSDARVRQMILDGVLKAERVGARMLNVNTTSVNALAARRAKKKADRDLKKGVK
jgi:excisionase family DNA binding protein